VDIAVRRKGVNADQLVLEAIDKQPGKFADLKTIQHATKLERTVVWRSLGRLMGSNPPSVKPNLIPQRRSRTEVRYLLFYAIPEGFPLYSPEVRRLARERLRSKKEMMRTFGLVWTAASKDEEWRRLAMEAEVTALLRLTLAEQRKEWGAGRFNGNLHLTNSRYGKDPDEIIAEVVSGIYNSEPGYNDFVRKGKSIIVWERGKIKDFVNQLVKQGALRIDRSYMLSASRKLDQWNNRVTGALRKKEEQVMANLRAQGRMKPSGVPEL
jgi:hypothetical protein